MGKSSDVRVTRCRNVGGTRGAGWARRPIIMCVYNSHPGPTRHERRVPVGDGYVAFSTGPGDACAGDHQEGAWTPTGPLIGPDASKTNGPAAVPGRSVSIRREPCEGRGCDPTPGKGSAQRPAPTDSPPLAPIVQRLRIGHPWHRSAAIVQLTKGPGAVRGGRFLMPPSVATESTGREHP